MVCLEMLFYGGWLFGAWLPFGEVFLDLLVDHQVLCKDNYSSLNLLFGALG